MKIQYEDDNYCYVTRPDLIAHMIKQHGEPAWILGGRFYMELENWHERFHHSRPLKGITIKGKHKWIPSGQKHSHPKPLRCIDGT